MSFFQPQFLGLNIASPNASFLFSPDSSSLRIRILILILILMLTIIIQLVFL